MVVADDGLFLNLAGLNETGPLPKSGRERRQEQWAKHRSEALVRFECWGEPCELFRCCMGVMQKNGLGRLAFLQEA